MGLKIFLKILYFLVIFCFLFSCKKETNTANTFVKKEKQFEWFSQEKNYKNKKRYYNKFSAEYNNCIENNQPEKAKLLLHNFGVLIHEKYVYDHLFSEVAEDFYNKNTKVKIDSTFALIYCYHAGNFYNNNEFEQAIAWSKKVLNINKNLQSIDINSRAKTIIADCYIATNQPEKAIQIFTDLISIDEKLKDYKSLGSLYYNLANSYNNLKAYNEADKFYKKSANSYLKVNDTLRYLGLQSSFAQTSFSHKKDTVATIQFLDSLLVTNKSYKNRVEISEIVVAEIKMFKSLLTKKYDSANYYNNISLNYFKKSEGIMIDFQLLDYEIYFQKNQKIKNKQETLNMIDKLLPEKRYLDCVRLYNQLYRDSKSKNNASEALFYRDKEITLNDSILKENQKGQLFEFDKKYQSEKKEKQIAQQQIQISKTKSLTIALLLALVIVVFGFVIYLFRKRRIEAEAETKRQEQFTFQLLQNTEEERSRIANELHDSVNHDLLNIKNSLINGKTIQANDVATVIEEVRNISRNLHPAVLETIGLEASIENMCERLTELGLFTTCEIDYTQKLTKNKEVQLYRIIQEALNNTLKHGKANAAKVNLTSQNNSLHLEVKDNGNGFDVNAQLKNPKSFGLQSIMQRAKAIAAKININSSTKGTVILLKIPL
jgi:two-component system, NarL family, sensor kinase